MLYRTCKRMIISIHALREEGDLTSAGFRRPTYNISIHALREEGDVVICGSSPSTSQFLSTPSARRATSTPARRRSWLIYFYPRPPRGGRRASDCGHADQVLISIHALREEGDLQLMTPVSFRTIFLSTPSARRATLRRLVRRTHHNEFLSTPSARRATNRHHQKLVQIRNFYPRPPRGGRPYPLEAL